MSWSSRACAPLQAETESLRGKLALAEDEAAELRFRLTTAQAANDRLRDMHADAQSRLEQARRVPCGMLVDGQHVLTPARLAICPPPVHN